MEDHARRDALRDTAAVAQVLSEETVERCLDHSLAHRLTTVGKVRGLIECLPAPAVSGRRMLLDLLTERASTGVGYRSGLEQRIGRWLKDAGLRGWQRNYPVPVATAAAVDSGIVEVDFGWPDHKVALEVSPFFTHGSRLTQTRDVERRRLLVERGWRVVEATDPDVENRRTFTRSVLALKTLLEAA